MRIILLDSRSRFRDDMRTRLLIDDDRNVDLVTDLSDSNGLVSAITRYEPELIVVADNVYRERSAWDSCGVPVVGYITKASGIDVFTQDGIPHYPFVSNATHLLNLLESGIPKVESSHYSLQSTYEQQSSTISTEPVPANTVSNPHSSELPNTVSTSTTATFIPLPTLDASQRVPANRPQSISFNNPADLDDEMFTPMIRLQTPSSHSIQQNDHPNPTQNEQHLPQMDYDPCRTNASEGVNEPLPWGQDQRSFPRGTIEDKKSAKEILDEERIRRNATMSSAAVLEDIAMKNTTTKTVAIYSAKGGVGKTTITTELATILSMTSNGRGNFRVCLVDYNVDFGDILTTLNLDNRGPNLTHWTADVRRRMQNGEDPDDIEYSRKEIEGRLQRVGNTTLYALVAPVTHEDSMDIRSEEPGIILRNIINNGCFDFVICDTGNNTRDATVSALDAADYIFMIATQDVSAVNCDKSFLQTMNRVGFEVDKIRLIMNGVMPFKYTQVSVEEVEEMFPYPCIARFKRDPEVTRANNCSEPIVRQPNHDFTREMRKIVAYLTGQQIPEDKPKGGFFSIFKRKG